MLNDFVEYWTAAKLMVEGGNPYSPAELLMLQRTVGWEQLEPLIMWNPPWTLSFIFFLGLFDYATAQFLWFLSHAVITFAGAQVLWQIYGSAAPRPFTATFAALSFAPVYLALLIGQIGPLVLLGVIVFLAAARRKSWTIAGAALVIAAVKPHLMHLVWLALALWTAKSGRWQIALGFVSAGAVAVSLPLLWNREIYLQYSALLDGSDVVQPLHWATPSLGTALAEFFLLSAPWIRWIPALAGAVWCVYHWAKRGATWEWIAELPLVLSVSLLTSPFVWTFDYVILLPAVVQSAAWSERLQARRRKLVITAYLVINVALLVVKTFVRNDFWYFWLGPLYLLLYLYVRAAAARQCVTEGLTA